VNLAFARLDQRTYASIFKYLPDVKLRGATFDGRIDRRTLVQLRTRIGLLPGCSWSLPLTERMWFMTVLLWVYHSSQTRFRREFTRVKAKQAGRFLNRAWSGIVTVKELKSPPPGANCAMTPMVNDILPSALWI
jgi:hypothetical protein